MKMKFSAAEMQESAMQSYMKNWVIVPNHPEHFQGGCMHSDVEISTEHCPFTETVSGHNWTVHERRYMVDWEGISPAYKNFWVHSAPNFTTWLKNVQNYCQVAAS
jgi:hypothetical protein